jgi:hypothetical protein
VSRAVILCSLALLAAEQAQAAAPREHGSIEPASPPQPQEGTTEPPQETEPAETTGQAEKKKEENESPRPADANDRPLVSVLDFEFFAFGDVLWVFDQDESDTESGFQLNQVEIDLAQGLGRATQVAAAVAFDGDSFGVGVWGVDFRIAGSGPGHFARVRRVDSLGLVFGQYDVPFGVDYQRYASPDRKLVTGPLVVGETHDSWNDLGGQLYLDAPKINWTLFGVNGFGYQREDATGEVVEYDTTIAAGTRLGIRPWDLIEVGGSAAAFFDDGGRPDMLLGGADLQLEVAGFSIAGELIGHFTGLYASDQRNHLGFYANVAYDFERWFLVARHSTFWPHVEDPVQQLAGGVGVRLVKGVEMRAQYESNLQEEGCLVLLQLVAAAGWRPAGAPLD